MPEESTQEATTIKAHIYDLLVEREALQQQSATAIEQINQQIQELHIRLRYLAG